MLCMSYLKEGTPITMKDFAITTSDNKFSPFTEFDAWYEFDEKEKGYKTCEYLARLVSTVTNLSDDYNDDIIEKAIDDIVKENIIGILTNYQVNYVKVFKE